MANYPENIMRRLRQREGRGPNDKFADQRLNELKPIDALREVCAWELGDPTWADTILEWARDCGLSVQEQDNG